MKIDTHPQGSSGWQAARLGIPTASTMDVLVTPSYKVSDSAGAQEYVWKKLAEKIMGYSAESVNTFSMNQGSVGEGEAVGWYEFETGQKVDRVGFCLTDDTRCGASPDGLLGDDNGLEIKIPTHHVHLEYLAGGVLPKEYRLQVQTELFVTGRPRWTFLSYSRIFPKFLITVLPDPKAQDAIATALDLFWDRFTAAEAKLLPQIAQKGRD
jgi:hypothetical protein